MLLASAHVLGANENWPPPYAAASCRASLEKESAFMLAAGRATGVYCKSRPVLYSASRQVAYVKTPKAASLAIQDLFQRQFPDYRWAEAHEMLPNGTFVFTFVREPVSRVLSAYAEIDVAYALRASPEARNAMQTTFQHVKRKPAYTPRFLAFLDDLFGHRFGGDDREHWMPTHAYPQLNFACVHRIDFIGHIETQEIDWAEVQHRAGIPLTQRTLFPRGHSTVNRTSNESVPICNRACTLKQDDQTVPLTDPVMQRLCDLYESDFLCLGYTIPSACHPRTREVSTTEMRYTSTIKGVPPLPSREAAAAAVYVLPGLDAGGARQMAEDPMYRNTLFVAACAFENRSSLFRLRRAMNTSFSPDPSDAGMLLREHDRYGWFWRIERNELGYHSNASIRAPLAIGIPLVDSKEPIHQYGACEGIERALAEAVQHLLLHHYDRVIIAGRGLLTLQKEQTSHCISGTLWDMIIGLLTEPMSAARFIANRRSIHKARLSNTSLTPHKHFLP